MNQFSTSMTMSSTLTHETQKVLCAEFCVTPYTGSRLQDFRRSIIIIIESVKDKSLFAELISKRDLKAEKFYFWSCFLHTLTHSQVECVRECVRVCNKMKMGVGNNRGGCNKMDNLGNGSG